MTRSKKIIRGLGWSVTGLLLLLNLVAALHAWRFTHFSPAGTRHPDPAALGTGQKIRIALTGVDNPRPAALRIPARPCITQTVHSNVDLEAWFLPADSAPKGTVILFHGYGGEKSAMLDKAEVLIRAGYQVLLPDFMGAGGSGGHQCTVGYREAENVRDCYAWVAQRYGRQPIFLLGTSMGAVAILKYLHDGGTSPTAIVLECPFGTMYQTVCARFRMVHAPTFPMAGLLLFWGGLENGFWAFGHNPETYARAVRCPALLLYGAQDDRVTPRETVAVFAGLGGPKTLCSYPRAGHNNALTLYPARWQADVLRFLAAAGSRSGHRR